MAGARARQTLARRWRALVCYHLPAATAAAIAGGGRRALAFGFDQHCRFQMNGETGYGIVEYMFTGGSRRYGIPRTEMGG